MARTVVSNPTNAVVTSAISCNAVIKDYLELTLMNDDGSSSKINLYPGADTLYEISFYSPKELKYITVIAKIIKVLSSFITVKYFTGLDTEGLCPCAHKDILLNYADTVTENVSISSIARIKEYVIEEEKPTPPKPHCREVTKVSILGISAEYIRSVIVRLRLYEDGYEVIDTTPVDMVVGNRYNVSYVDHKDHTMYEIDGVLKAINIDQNFGDEPYNHGFVRHECECSSHDCIGMNNVPYDSNEDKIYDMDHFLSLPKQCSDKVSFTFDTSGDMHSTFDTVFLNDIRGVTLIEGDGTIDIIEPPLDSSRPVPPPPPHKYCCCGSCCSNEGYTDCPGNGTCCNNQPTNIPNPCPPPIHHHHHHHNDNSEPIEVDNYKVYLGVPDNNFFMTIEDSTTGDIVENVNIRDMIDAYIKQMNQSE